MIKEFLAFFKSFKYYVVTQQVISWFDSDTKSTINSVSLTFLENGRGKRKVEKGHNQFKYSCDIEAHQYWQEAVIPWLNEVRRKTPNKPVLIVNKEKSKGNVVNVDFGKKK